MQRFPMFDELEHINRRPAVFEFYTAASLWAEEYRSRKMLAYHLKDDVDLSSRNIGFIDRSSSWMVDHFRLRPGKTVCDFGCGPGFYASRLARSGAHVTGLDFSKNSIRYACEKAAEAGQEINYVQADYLSYDPTEKFDLITMIMCDFCALSPAQRKVLLAKINGCLKEDGAVLLDVYSMTAFDEREEASFYEKNQLDQFWFEGDYYCFVNTFKYASEAVVLDKYSLFTEDGARETVYNWLQYFSPESLKDELSAAGFATRQVFNDVSGSAYSQQHSEFAVVAEKL